ncbi:RHS repeat-associated protein, partial [Leeuwenhoekiella aestuarii]|uniref:RHS repeat domain-containing protein n=1 Tax=Leeuwenhoekiella aestuarii TaxID=2249426 RepID=UPI001024AB75
DYTYNIRGWLKTINNPSSLGNDLFAFKLNYNTVTHNATKLFNGNISESEWRTANTDNSLKWYKYSYDPLNRIKTALGNIANRYDLNNVSYDKNGNITALSRDGHTNTAATSFGLMDNLIYTYAITSNKLTKVRDDGNGTFGFRDGVDTSAEFTYDANGNMVKDLNKGISSISYNHLNLPDAVNVTANKGDGTGTISYIYDAAGIKLEKSVSGEVTQYAGNYIYKKVNNTTTLEFFNQPEGYVEKAGSRYKYVYQYKDHLGNVRLSYKNIGSALSPNLKIQDEINYYPFGLEHKGYNNAGGAEYNYKTFQGQEEEKELGKNTYAFQWRDYDPAIGRFNKMDRFAEKYKNVTPYQFALNSPMRYTEIKGDSINLRSIQQYDKKNGTNYTQTIVDNLSETTGLQLTADSKTGMLTYATDDNGNALLTQVAYEDENGVIRDDVTADGGSEIARNDLVSAIDNKETGFARINNKSSALRGGLLINISPNQINKFINGANNVNSNTLGYGMIFLHEMHHSALGLGVGDDKSKFGATGGVVDRMNKIRGELSNQSFMQSYGQRTSYMARSSSGGKAYLPMDQGSYKRLNGNQKPTTASQKFIEF